MRKSVEMKQALQKLKDSMQALLDEGKVAEAHAKVSELNELKDAIKVQEMLEKEEAEDFTGSPVNEKQEVNENVVFNKLLLGKPLNAAEREFVNAAGTPGQVESDDTRGGYLVPKAQETQIKELKRALHPLKDLCTVVPVNTLSGTMPMEVEAADKLINFDELNAITESDIKFGNIAWKVSDYGDLIPISNSLLEDETANLTDFVGKRFAKKAVRTENAKILAILDGATAKTGADYKAIKSMLNKELDPAIASGAVIICNQTTFDWLDQLEDANKHPLLQPMLTDPTKKAFAGHEVVVVADEDIAQEEKNYVLYIGNVAEYLAFFDRKGVEMAVSKEAGFTKNATFMRVIERFDVQKVDAKAMVKLTITVA